MTSTLKDLAGASLDEIIFEGRNQEYGAFQLRRLYDRHLKQAAVLATILLLVLMLMPRIMELLAPDELAGPRIGKPIVDVWIKPTVVPPLDKPVQPTPPPVEVRVNTTRFTPPRVVTDTDPTPPAELTTMSAANAADNLGTRTVTNGTDAAPSIEAPAGDAPDASADADKVWDYVEQPAEYPGGTAALLTYVGHHIKYPGVALRNNVQGRVYIKFVVDETGQVRQATVLKGIGAGCDEEAIRVISSLPRFEPARQNGRPVKVYFSLPINFRYE